MESLAYIEVFLANQENKDFKLIEGLNWNKLSSFAYINFLSIMMINLIIIDSSWARRPEIPGPETNSYFNSQTYQGQTATNSFFSGTSSFRPESNAILSPNSAVYLRRGDKATTVTAVQRKLRELGYFYANLTGYYGPITERAVRQFQEDKGIAATGQIEPTTWSLLFAGNRSKQINSSLLNSSTRVLYFGQVSPQVAIIQRRLAELGFYRGPINSIYDQNTRTAVIRFQNAHRITPTGQVGITTREYLFGIRPVPVERVFLRPGETGLEIGRLQQRLKSLGYYQGQITNYFDRSTEIAVIEFQKINRITPTGIVGPTTQAFLFNPSQVLPPGPVSYSRENYTARQYSYSSVLRRGDRGLAVKQLQILLTRLGYYPGIVDGVFGPGTEFAVKCFQQDVGTNANGIATRNTLQALRHPTAIAPSNSHHRATYIGSTANVLELQKRLRVQGLYFGPLNGVYNSQTRAAVAKAQMRYGLSAKDIEN
ncbi:MAG: peptidoglycan-binding protein [Okeania sp. SIO3B5]|uniref:peptidoglycan-binding domain-containing protein n=1 Tax=Okeania sp. SIO3B5 TaxID=2607811 RepID=UPI0014018868|nr:peptidoglycan-binding protein [Okeania sp. SIO3B5]NEO52351.1 peptidoglycan-binding protein [Okeania sp. SIO3B5]